MRIGFCSGYDEGRMAFAAEAGFDGLEIFANEDMLSADGAKRAKERLDKHGIVLLSLFHFQDYGAEDPATADQAVKNMLKAIKVCKIMGTNIVTCNAFAAGANRDEQLKHYKKTFGKFAKAAEDNGVKIAIENCPHGRKNLGFSPPMWEKMFNEVPSPAIGLEFDPSHLVWMFIDWLPSLYQFGSRVYMFHAKDTEVRHEVLSREGITAPGWWRYRLPGWGQVDWKKVISALHDIGYTGDMSIEHEDPVYGGALTDKGLRMGLSHLRSLL